MILTRGKPIKNKKAAWWVLVGREDQLFHRALSDPQKDCGRFPIGPDCYRKHPEFRGYVEKGACAL
jgi:hypothetical protein